MTWVVDGIDLDHHGDREVGPGLLDLAVNVRFEPPPPWLTSRIAAACRDLSAYPDSRPATGAVAAMHGCGTGQVLLTSGAAEAFTLIARAVPAGRAVVVHPQFTEPERAMRIAGHEIVRHVLDERDGFRLRPVAVPADADLVVVGNPTNPTGVAHRASDLLALLRPGRTVVVDEAFMDAVAGEPDSLIPAVANRPLASDGRLIVVRSLTKTWGLAGLRIGYLLSDQSTIELLRRQQSPWSVSTPALAAALACTSGEADLERSQRAARLAAGGERLRAGLAERGLTCVDGSVAPFLLVRLPDEVLCRYPDGIWPELRRYGVAVRRADTFPGLGTRWFRVAVRDDATNDALLVALDKALGT